MLRNDLLGLLGDVVADHLAGRWIKATLAGEEDPLSD